MGFNLSKWALEHRPFVVYLMIVTVVAGVVSYVRLGRDEDPAFVIKTMVVRAAWPGATMEDTLNQITERAQLHQSWRHDDLRKPEWVDPRQGCRRHLEGRAQQHPRHVVHPAEWRRRSRLR
jgi:hypothetical protein